MKTARHVGTRVLIAARGGDIVPCPSVVCTSGREASRWIACEPWACRSQWGETASLIPALAAVRFTMPLTARSVSEPPLRLRKIGSDGRMRVAIACSSIAAQTGPQRRITRWEHEVVLEAVQKRLDENPQAMRQRRETVEHPFGTMKARMGATHFLMKRLPKVATEMALHVLAYDLTRVLNIVGVKPLIAAMRLKTPHLKRAARSDPLTMPVRATRLPQHQNPKNMLETVAR